MTRRLQVSVDEGRTASYQRGGQHQTYHHHSPRTHMRLMLQSDASVTSSDFYLREAWMLPPHRLGGWACVSRAVATMFGEHAPPQRTKPDRLVQRFPVFKRSKVMDWNR